jgi:hypothetical protein
MASLANSAVLLHSYLCRWHLAWETAVKPVQEAAPFNSWEKIRKEQSKTRVRYKCSPYKAYLLLPEHTVMSLPHKSDGFAVGDVDASHWPKYREVLCDEFPYLQPRNRATKKGIMRTSSSVQCPCNASNPTLLL